MFPFPRLRTSATPPSVLIVDRSAESREVLRTVLGRRGWVIYEARDGASGLEMAQQHHPGLIVLDLETDSAEDAHLRAELDERSRRENTPVVLLGTTARQKDPRPGCQLVSKPYHYGPLIRTIEALLQQARPRRSAA